MTFRELKLWLQVHKVAALSVSYTAALFAAVWLLIILSQLRSGSTADAEGREAFFERRLMESRATAARKAVRAGGRAEARAGAAPALPSAHGIGQRHYEVQVRGPEPRPAGEQAAPPAAPSGPLHDAPPAAEPLDRPPVERAPEAELDTEEAPGAGPEEVPAGEVE